MCMQVVAQSMFFEVFFSINRVLRIHFIPKTLNLDFEVDSITFLIYIFFFRFYRTVCLTFKQAWVFTNAADKYKLSE